MSFENQPKSFPKREITGKRRWGKGGKGLGKGARKGKCQTDLPGVEARRIRGAGAVDSAQEAGPREPPW